MVTQVLSFLRDWQTAFSVVTHSHQQLEGGKSSIFLSKLIICLFDYSHRHGYEAVKQLL